MDIEFIKDVLLLFDYLNEILKKYFEVVFELLNFMNILYEIDRKLVCGLDYYVYIVFEIYVIIKGFGV